MALEASGGAGKGMELCSLESVAELGLLFSGIGSLVAFSLASSSVGFVFVSGTWMIFSFSPQTSHWELQL